MNPPSHNEDKRQIEHVAPIIFAFLLPYLTWLAALGLAFLSILYGLYGSRLLVRGTHRRDEDTRGFSLGKVCYGVSVFLLILFFHERMFVVGAVWANLAVGDSISNVFGRRWGRRRLPWNPDKSWVGLAAFVIGGTLAGAVLIWWIGAPAKLLVTWPQIWGYAVLAAGVCGLTESLPDVINDNLSLCFTGGIVLFAATFQDWQWGIDANRALQAVGVNLTLGTLGFMARTVNASGWLVGMSIGAVIYYAAGWQGYAVLLLFFALGSTASKLGYRKKDQQGLAQAAGGRRGAAHAVANCLTGVLCACGVSLTTLDHVMILGLAGAFATATFDTLATELGQLWGRHPVLLFPPRRVPPGTEGAVSLEGTLAGLAGSVLVAALAMALKLVSPAQVWCIPFGAVTGSMLESILGSRDNRAVPYRNEILNFINTAVGAAATVFLAAIFTEL